MSYYEMIISTTDFLNFRLNMKKTLFLLIAILAASLPLYAKTFLGVEEFASKSVAKSNLYDSYGYLSVDEQGSDLVVTEPTFAGFRFSIAILYFSPINGGPRFNGINFQRWYQSTQIKEAKDFRDALMNSLRTKYGDEIYAEFKNEQGFKCCEFGTYNDGSLGLLEMTREKGKDGKERLYVLLTYYPFDMKAVQNEL